MEIEVDVRSPSPTTSRSAPGSRGSSSPGRSTRDPVAPIRQLAGHLGPMNGAVARAYGELEREGTVETAVKRGTTVARLPVGGAAGDDDGDLDPRGGGALLRVLAAEPRAALNAVLPVDLVPR